MSDDIHCPKCKSTQITAQKHGFSAGKAVAGAVLTGGIGLLAGLHGSSNIDIICLKCGNKWNPSKLAEQVKREAAVKEFSAQKEWKSDWYRAYGEKRFEDAERIYFSKNTYPANVKDIHAAYKFHTNQDLFGNLIMVVFLLGFIFFMFWIFG